VGIASAGDLERCGINEQGSGRTSLTLLCFWRPLKTSIATPIRRAFQTYTNRQAMARQCAPLLEIPKALEKTGFLLEHVTAEKFRSAGWTVIGNRYYVDDVDERTRELDIVAYRVKKSDDVDVVSVVLISCKKDAEHTWAFMSKEKPSTDPNLDWEPVHYWTDCEPLASYLSTATWRSSYIHSNPEVYASMFNATRNIFAFQQVSSNGQSPKNDRQIFDATTGLLKALDYELGALSHRAKQRKRLYVFTQIAVVDAPLVDVQYHGTEGTAIEVSRLLHVARYMVKKRELSAYIHFIRSDQLGSVVEDLGRWEAHNAAHMSMLVTDAYEAIRSNDKVQAFFAKRLQARLIYWVNRALDRLGERDHATQIGLSYENGALTIELDSDGAERLNEDAEIRERAAKLLRDIARYEGPISFEWDVPF
jgi:hypothetical protein